MFIFVDSDLKFETPQIELKIDHDKANRLGITMQDIGGSLATLLGGNFVNRFNLYGRSYQVIPQVPRDFRLTSEWLQRYQVRTSAGALVPLSSIVSIEQSVQPNALDHLPAAQLGDAHRRAVPRPHGGRGAGLAEGQGRGAHAGGLLLRLPGREPPVRAGRQHAGHHLRVRAHHHLPGAGGAVRELPRPADHSDRAADRHVRRADPDEPRARHHQHLHPGRARDADRPHLQARHPDGGLRQPPAGERGAFAAARRSSGRRRSGCGPS